MLHDTNFRAKKQRKLDERVKGRWNDTDVQYSDETRKIVDFYSYFKKGDEFKKKHARSLSMIYSKKLSLCPNCGLRLPERAVGQHLNWHFKIRNKVKKLRNNFINGLCRHWYLEKDSWLYDDPFDNNESNINPFNNISNNNNSKSIIEHEIDVNNALNIKNNSEYYRKFKIYLQKNKDNSDILPICNICHEKFTDKDKNYDTNLDEWMLENACYIDGTTYQDHPSILPIKLAVVHKKCYDIRSNETNDNTMKLIPDINDDDNDIQNNLNDIINDNSSENDIENILLSNDDEMDMDTENISRIPKKPIKPQPQPSLQANDTNTESKTDNSEPQNNVKTSNNKENNSNNANSDTNSDDNINLAGMPQLESASDLISSKNTDNNNNNNNTTTNDDKTTTNNDDNNKPTLTNNDENNNNNNNININSINNDDKSEDESDLDDIDIDDDADDDLGIIFR